MSDKPLLSVIGLGVKIPDHATTEAMRAMALCDRIFAVVQEPPAVWLPPSAAGKIPVTNILGLYVEGTLRTQNYDRAAETIFQSVRDGQTIGYVTYGNPLAYDSVAQNLVRRAQQAGTRFQVVPGISSVDTLLCDLGTDMAPGLQVYEASWLVAAQIRLHPTVAAILLQVGMFGTLRTHYRTRPEARSLAELAEYLGRSYPPSHNVFLVRSAGAAGDPPHIKESPLGNLCDVTSEDLLNCSMYIPSLEPTSLDERFLAAMQEA
jgi:precorrin-2 methylase